VWCCRVLIPYPFTIPYPFAHGLEKNRLGLIDSSLFNSLPFPKRFLTLFIPYPFSFLGVRFLTLLDMDPQDARKVGQPTNQFLDSLPFYDSLAL
jgi:hypothetical protein